MRTPILTPEQIDSSDPALWGLKPWGEDPAKLGNTDLLYYCTSHPCHSLLPNSSLPSSQHFSSHFLINYLWEKYKKMRKKFFQRTILSSNFSKLDILSDSYGYFCSVCNPLYKWWHLLHQTLWWKSHVRWREQESQYFTVSLWSLASQLDHSHILHFTYYWDYQVRVGPNLVLPCSKIVSMEIKNRIILSISEKLFLKYLYTSSHTYSNKHTNISWCHCQKQTISPIKFTPFCYLN